MKVNINGDAWDILVVTEKRMIKERSDGEHLAGLCIPDEKVIYIAEDCITLETVTHELYHSYFHYLFLEDTNNLSILDLEEITASHFTAKGHEIIKKAKHVYRQLQGGKR